MTSGIFQSARAERTSASENPCRTKFQLAPSVASRTYTFSPSRWGGGGWGRGDEEHGQKIPSSTTNLKASDADAVVLVVGNQVGNRGELGRSRVKAVAQPIRVVL